MGANLFGCKGRFDWTPGVGGETIGDATPQTVELMVYEDDMGGRVWNTTPAGSCTTEYSFNGFDGKFTVGFFVTDTSSSGPPVPTGVTGTFTVYKNSASTSTGKWSGSGILVRRKWGFRGGGVDAPPQMVYYDAVLTGALTQTL